MQDLAHNPSKCPRWKLIPICPRMYRSPPPTCPFLCSKVMSWNILLFSRSSTTPTGDTSKPGTCPACFFGEPVVRPLATSIADFCHAASSTLSALEWFYDASFFARPPPAARPHIYSQARYVSHMIYSGELVFVPKKHLHDKIIQNT